MDAQFKETLINGRRCKYWVKVGSFEFDFSNVYRATRIAFKINSPINDTRLLQLNLLINSPSISIRNFRERTNTSCIRPSQIISRIVTSSINQSSPFSSATHNCIWQLYSQAQYRVSTLKMLRVNSFKVLLFRTAILWHGVKRRFSTSTLGPYSFLITFLLILKCELSFAHLCGNSNKQLKGVK